MDETQHGFRALKKDNNLWLKVSVVDRAVEQWGLEAHRDNNMAKVLV